MRAAGNSSKRLLVCLGAQIVLQTNTGKPRTRLNIREGDNQRPLYCCFHFSLEHYSGCCTGKGLSACSALAAWLVPWVGQGAAVSAQTVAPFCSGPGGPQGSAQVNTRATCPHQLQLCSSVLPQETISEPAPLLSWHHPATLCVPCYPVLFCISDVS